MIRFKMGLFEVMSNAVPKMV